MTKDVEAVNTLLEAEKTNSTEASSLLDCDYVAYVPFFLPHVSTLTFFSQLQHGSQRTRWRVLGRSQFALNHLPDPGPYPF